MLHFRRDGRGGVCSNVSCRTSDMGCYMHGMLVQDGTKNLRGRRRGRYNKKMLKRPIPHTGSTSHKARKTRCLSTTLQLGAEDR